MPHSTLHDHLAEVIHLAECSRWILGENICRRVPDSDWEASESIKHDECSHSSPIGTMIAGNAVLSPAADAASEAARLLSSCFRETQAVSKPLKSAFKHCIVPRIGMCILILSRWACILCSCNNLWRVAIAAFFCLVLSFSSLVAVHSCCVVWPDASTYCRYPHLTRLLSLLG